jgi:hypothetical protein
MKTFTDNAGRTWTVAINVDAIKRVKGLLDVNLLEIVEGTLIEKLIRDPVLLCDVIYAVCKPQADEQNISDEDFGRAMAGDAIEHATRALLDELVGFSPKPERSGEPAAGAARRLAGDGSGPRPGRSPAEQRPTRNGADRDRKLDAQLATANDSSGSVPASSGSTPEHSRLVN